MSALAKKRERLNALVAEVAAGEAKINGAVNAEGVCTLPVAEVTAINAKAQEAIAMQEDIKSDSRREQVVAFSREIVTNRAPSLEVSDGGQKGRRVRVTLGQKVVGSKAYRDFIKSGKPKTSDVVLAENIESSMADGYAFLTPEEAKDYDADLTPLSIPGASVLDAPMRDPEIVRYEERRRPALRDLVNVSPTSSSLIEWVRELAPTGDAEIVPATNLKPYIQVNLEKVNTAVKVLAVMAKVTEQQLEDTPALINIIDVEMRSKLRLLEEREMLWGDGTGDHFSGLFTDQGVQAFSRAVGGDTLLDTIRRMRTDIILRELDPSGVLVHPLDWEAIELLKGTDDRYVWGVIRTVIGPMVWSMPVVESKASEDATTGQRLIVVADWKNGATLWDRHDIRVAVGFVDDDFRRNLRSLRAENRLAFGVKRPHAFVVFESEGGSS